LLTLLAKKNRRPGAGDFAVCNRNYFLVVQVLAICVIRFTWNAAGDSPLLTLLLVVPLVELGVLPLGEVALLAETW